ncbi:MAG: hypothetical protein S0880_02410 [Actinomycetota bacterium]|nr:hypothetical protein [Actinomycetota bacterium]
MVRTLDLEPWAGRWVALDDTDTVQRDAATLRELLAIIDAEQLENLEVVRAATPDEPIAFGIV